MTRISDLNRVQDLNDGDVFPIGTEDGSTRGVTAKDAAKYFTSEIEPIVDEAKQAALEAQQSAEAAAESAASSDALVLRQELAALGGAGLVGFSGGDPGLFATRTVADAMKGSMRFDDFKGATDDEKWASLVAYSNIADVTSIAVEFGARTHIFNSNPGTLTKPFVFRGKGNRNTFLRFDECNGIAADLSGYGSKFIQSRFEHLSLVANSSNTKTGIYFKGFQSLEPHDASLVLRSISLYGLHEIDNSAPPALEWGKAIHLLDADEISIDDVFITGSSDNGNYPTRTTSKGIFAETVTGLRVGVTNIYLCGIGIEVTGQSEGAILDGLALVAVDQGILFRDLTNPANNHCITSTHVAAHTKGIEFRQNALSTSNAVAVFMSNLFILERSGEASKPLYTGIEAYVQKSSFSNIVVQSNDATTPARIGMIVSNQDNLLTNIYGRNPGVMLDAKAIDGGRYLYCTSFRSSGSLSELISGDIAVVVGSGIGASPSDANANTNRADTHRNIDLQGRGQYENIGGRHSFGYGRHNANVYLDFRTFPGGTADYDGRLFFSGGHATATGQAIALLYAAQARFSGNVTPITTNTGTCGTSTNTWAGGFTQTAFTVTSDERSKTAQLAITDAMLDAAADVDWCMFQYLDRIEEKGADGARWHFGAIAQRFVEAFQKHGLDPFRFAFICYDEWDASPELIGEDGEVISPAVDAGSRYGIRYDQAIILKQSQIERDHKRQLDALVERIEALEHK